LSERLLAALSFVKRPQRVVLDDANVAFARAESGLKTSRYGCRGNLEIPIIRVGHRQRLFRRLSMGGHAKLQPMVFC